MPFAHTSTLTPPPVLGRLLLRSHQPDLGHVAIHGPQGVLENWKEECAYWCGPIIAL